MPTTFEEAVLKAVNLGDDADTTGAICGQLAGAYWGESSIPESLQVGSGTNGHAGEGVGGDCRSLNTDCVSAIPRAVERGATTSHSWAWLWEKRSHFSSMRSPMGSTGPKPISSLWIACASPTGRRDSSTDRSNAKRGIQATQHVGVFRMRNRTIQVLPKIYRCRNAERGTPGS